MTQRDTVTVAVLFIKPAFVTTPKNDMGGIIGSCRETSERQSDILPDHASNTMHSPRSVRSWPRHASDRGPRPLRQQPPPPPPSSPFFPTAPIRPKPQGALVILDFLPKFLSAWLVFAKLVSHWLHWILVCQYGDFKASSIPDWPDQTPRL